MCNTKTCKVCGETKSRTEFYSKRAECKACTRHREYLKSGTHRKLCKAYTVRRKQAEMAPGAATKAQTDALLANVITCAYCGCSLADEQKTLDHVVPLSRGGTHELTNLVVCCRSCNSTKGNRTTRKAA